MSPTTEELVLRMRAPSMPEIHAAEPRPVAHPAYGRERRAWTVRLAAGERSYRVAEYDAVPGVPHTLSSERGRPLVCHCTGAALHAGWCEHGAVVARHVGGADPVAEARTAEVQRGPGRRHVRSSDDDEA